MSAGIDERIRDLPVTVRLDGDDLTLEAELPGTASALWRAVTDPGELARWSPIVPERPLLEPGPVLARESPEADPVTAASGPRLFPLAPSPKSPDGQEAP